ncbi:HD domain-containing protein [Tunicatimonas pelagia]|uniref:HD domain-containing protein n=1 Tax=Tunicatimonas pelagia TaxID=931531 RepID=UPI00266609B0|nr:HD domain-containing protein [Tunicatimonas pelagia]WKN44508.1 HD domain-containing protein [Tunicatimonas pelagia]
MTRTNLIQTTTEFVQSTLADAEAGHDWWHTYRVWQNARQIAQSETANRLVVELGALLHDIADAKFHGGDEEIGPHTAQQFLEEQAVSPTIIEHVTNIVRHISFKGGNFQQTFHSPELAIVQDADRLDALGAIGIARTFHYGGFRNRPLYNPNVPPNLNMSREEYKSSQAPTINHFYEKLLLLKDRMNTATGKQLADKRHQFMEQFLAQFYQEWNPEG